MINHTKLDLFEFLDYMKRQAGNNLRIKSLKFCYIVCALQVFYSLKEKEKGGNLLLLPPYHQHRHAYLLNVAIKQ